MNEVMKANHKPIQVIPPTSNATVKLRPTTVSGWTSF